MPSHLRRPQDYADNESDPQLTCGGGLYGAERLNRKMEMAHQLFDIERGGLPNGWSLSAALINPFTDHQLAPLLVELVAVKKLDRWANETYPERIAALSLWITRRPWNKLNRYGAAWAALYLGMHDHDYRTVEGCERLVHFPPSDFFEAMVYEHNSVSRLAAFLRTTFFHDHERQVSGASTPIQATLRRRSAEQRLQGFIDNC